MNPAPAGVVVPRFPWRVRLANQIGPLAARLSLGDGHASFDVAGLLDDARRSTGLDDFGPDDYLPGLRVLAEALDHEAPLTFHGRRAVRAGLVGTLRSRLYVARDAARHAEIAQVRVERPVFVIGLLRSGSTLLHNLLAQHPDVRVPLLWELASPASPAPGAEAEAALVRATQAYVDDYHRMAPRLPSVHFIDALRPDECHRLLGNAFASMVYQMRYDVPSYARFVDAHDSTAAYQYHRRQLQHILWRKPGGPAALKCPFHVWKLEELLSVYPDARLLHLHRDPLKVIPSTCSLCVVVRGARAARIDLARVGAQWLDWTTTALERVRRFDRGAWPQAGFLDVHYHDLMRDTLGTMERVCEFIGVSLTDAAREAMRAWLAANRQDKHGRHDYTAEQFGLDRDVIVERCAGYRREFAVATEN